MSRGVNPQFSNSKKFHTQLRRPPKNNSIDARAISTPMPRYTVTPWRDVSELLRLRSQLYQLGEFKDADRRQEAVNQVSATHPPVPRRKKKSKKKY